MKRVQSACLMQTHHFMLDPNVSSEEAIKKVILKVEKYRNNSKDLVRILNEKTLEDGSVILSIKKKVSGYNIGNYFN